MIQLLGDSYADELPEKVRDYLRSDECEARPLFLTAGSEKPYGWEIGNKMMAGNGRMGHARMTVTVEMLCYAVDPVVFIRGEFEGMARRSVEYGGFRDGIDPEEAAMIAHLRTASCPKCGAVGAMKLTGECRYSNPLQYVCKCTCGKVSSVGYDGIPVRTADGWDARKIEVW